MIGAGILHTLSRNCPKKIMPRCSGLRASSTQRATQKCDFCAQKARRCKKSQKRLVCRVNGCSRFWPARSAPAKCNPGGDYTDKGKSHGKKILCHQRNNMPAL